MGSSLNFGSSGTTSSIRVTYSKHSNGGRIEMRLDGPDGDIIGEFSPSNTGSWDVYEDEMVAIDHIDGVHDLTFVGKDVNWIMKMKSFELIGSIAVFGTSISPSLSPKTIPNKGRTCFDSPLDVKVD